MGIDPKTLVDVYLDGAAQSHKSAMRVITRLRATLAERDAEIAALKAEREWEPISDKHKDGETWWLADARGMDISACGYWDDEAEAPFQWRISDTERLHNDLFTHAMKPTQPSSEAT